MGGTTAKAGVIYKGEPLTTGSALIGGYEQALPVQIAMMDIFEVGTGGGSIARVEDGRAARRPAKRGRRAGPGLLRPRRHRADRHRRQSRARPAWAPTASSAARCGSTSRRRSARCTTRVAKPLGMDVTAAADGILRIAATAMSYAVKGVTTERGLDVGDFALVAYGGAGPLHAVEVAREIGIRKVIIPTAPGVFSAFGMLFSDLRYDYVRTWFTRLDDAPFDEIERIYRELEDEGRARDRQHLGRSRRRSRSSAPPTCAMSARSTPSPSICRWRCSRGRTARRSSGISTRSTSCATAPPRRTSAPRSSACARTVTGVMRKPPQERIAPRQERRRKAAFTGKRPVYFGEQAASSTRRPMRAPRSPPATASAGRR